MNRHFLGFKEKALSLDHMTDYDYRQIEPLLSIRKVKLGEKILEEGQECREFGFISEGAFRKYLVQDGKEINSWFYLDGDYVTQHLEVSRYTIEALEDAILVTICCDKLDRLFEISHSWERFGRLLMEEQLQKVVEHREALLQYNGKERYRWLLYYHPELITRIPLYHLSSFLGLERQSLSRLRGEIARE